MEWKVTRRIIFVGEPLPEHWEIGFFPNGVATKWERIDVKATRDISPVRTDGRYMVRDTKDGKFVGDVEFRKRVQTVFVPCHRQNGDQLGIYASMESAERDCAVENATEDNEETPYWSVFEEEVLP